MTTSLASNAAHTVARILANRPTHQDEISELIETVFATFETILAPAPVPAAPVASERATVARRRRGKARQHHEAAPFRTVDEEPVAPAPAPTLLRRADVVAPPSEHAGSFLTPSGSVRSIVKWFDARSRRGALRVPGYGNDVPVEGAMLAEAESLRRAAAREEAEQLLRPARPR
jgi:hypothetical protein